MYYRKQTCVNNKVFLDISELDIDRRNFIMKIIMYVDERAAFIVRVVSNINTAAV